jgi:hypothetical protein
MEAFQGINWEEWRTYIKSVKGRHPELSEPGGLFADPVPLYVNGFFETQKPLLESFFKLTDEERIECLRSHTFITFKNSYVERTHSLSHICEESVFSPDDGEMTGATCIALERLHFNYLSKDLEFPNDLYDSWRDSVYTAWGYFCLPDLLTDLYAITERESERAETFYFLAECLQSPEHEDLNAARKAYETFIELNKNKPAPENNYFISENSYHYFMYTPSVMEAYSGMARIFLSLGNLDAYEAYLLKSIESDRYHHVAPYLELAYFYLKSGKPLDALKYTCIYEDVFEARVKSFDFSEEFFSGHDISRNREGYLSHIPKWNWIHNSYQSDCLEINNSRLKWRFKKYPYLAISLHNLDQADPALEGHKSFFQISYTDVHTLIENVYMNILHILMINDEESDIISWLFERVSNKESYTWDCFPDLKRFGKEELVEIRLKYLIRKHQGYEALEIINDYVKKGPVSEKVLNKYKEEILNETPWLKRYIEGES